MLLENLPQLNYLSFHLAIPMVKLMKWRYETWDQYCMWFYKQFWKQNNLWRGWNFYWTFYIICCAWLSMAIWTTNNIEQHYFSKPLFASWLIRWILFYYVLLILLHFLLFVLFWTLFMIIHNFIYINNKSTVSEPTLL